MSQPGDSDALRLDKWLWHARFFKTRSLATRAVQSGAVRLNGTRVTKPATMVRPEDVLTFAQGHRIRVIEVRAPGTRRGPATEAAELYHDRSPAPESGGAEAPRVGPRPTKKDRRALEKSRPRSLE